MTSSYLHKLLKLRKKEKIFSSIDQTEMHEFAKVWKFCDVKRMDQQRDAVAAVSRVKKKVNKINKTKAKIKNTKLAVKDGPVGL